MSVQYSGRMSPLRSALYFGIYGPLIGAAVLFMVVAPILFGQWDQAHVGRNLMSIPWTLAYSIWIVPLALILGIIPGSATGLAYGWLQGRAQIAGLPALARVAIMSAVGGAACVLFGVCLGAKVMEMLSAEILPLFIAPGMVAAAVCTWLADRRASVEIHG
jgi:hypothetical protein